MTISIGTYAGLIGLIIFYGGVYLRAHSRFPSGRAAGLRLIWAGLMIVGLGYAVFVWGQF